MFGICRSLNKGNWLIRKKLEKVMGTLVSVQEDVAKVKQSAAVLNGKLDQVLEKIANFPQPGTLTAEQQAQLDAIGADVTETLGSLDSSNVKADSALA